MVSRQFFACLILNLKKKLLDVLFFFSFNFNLCYFQLFLIIIFFLILVIKIYFDRNTYVSTYRGRSTKIKISITKIDRKNTAVKALLKYVIIPLYEDDEQKGRKKNK